MGVKILETTKDVYHKALKKVTLFGPTIFSDIIYEVADSARVKSLNQYYDRWFLLEVYAIQKLKIK